MKSKASFRYLLLAVCVGIPANITLGAETDLQLAAGDALLSSLPVLKEGHTEMTYFEVQLNQKAVGIGELALACRKAENQLVYDYRHHLSVKLPTGVLMTLNVQAILTPKFQPLAIDVERSVILPDGQAFSGEQSATMEGGKIVLESNEGEMKTTREFPMPKVNFVYALDALMPRLQKKQKKPFALRNIDLESGGLAEIHCSWLVNDQRKEQLNLSKDGGASVDEYFVFEFSGAYIGYGKIDPPFFEVQTTQSRQQEVKKLLGLE